MQSRHSNGLDRMFVSGFSRRRLLGAIGAAAIGIAAAPGTGRSTGTRAEADSGLRDFGATAVLLGRSPAMAGYAPSGDYTLLSAAAAERTQQPDLTVIEYFFGDLGLRQERHDTFFNESGSGRVYLTQYQFPNGDSAAAAWDSIGQTLDYPGADDVSREYTDAARSAARRFSFQSGEGEEIRRHNSWFQISNHVVTGTYDLVDGAEDPEELAFEAFADLLAGYDDGEWGGAVGEEAQSLTRWMPVTEGTEEHRYNYGVVNGLVLPRYRRSLEEIEAENRGVANALFGSFGTSGTEFPIAVYYGARELQDLLRSDEYWEQFPTQMANNGSGVNWRPTESWIESGLPHQGHAGTWNPAEGVYLTGAHLAVQAGTNIFDIGAFTSYGGDPAAFAELDPTEEHEYELLRSGVEAITKERIAEFERPGEALGWSPGYLPEQQVLPSAWR